MLEKRLAPLSGVLFMVLLIGSFVADANTEFMPAESDVLTRLESGPLRVMVGAYLTLLAAAALLWFSGSIYKSLRGRDDDEGRLSILAFGGGVFASAMLGLGGVATVAAAERVWTNNAIDPGVAAAMTDINGIALGNGAPIGLAVLIGIWGMVGLQERGRSPWIGWVSIVIALGLISPFGWIAIGGAALWIPAVGVWMYRTMPTRAPVGVT